MPRRPTDAPPLRLVGSPPPAGDAGRSRADSGDGASRGVRPSTPLHLAGPGEDDRARFAVERETKAAAARMDLSPMDPRWVLAVRAASQMEDGVMTPERRARVMRTAERLGVRPFDASVIIAMVQDRLRTRGDLRDIAPQLSMVATPVRRPRTSAWMIAIRFGLAAACAAAVVVALARWITAPGVPASP